MTGWRLALGLAALLHAGPAFAAGFDAIAIDENTGGARGNGDYALGHGPTAAEAERIAMSNCTAGGNVACRVRLTFRQCGAYASSRAKAGTGLGDTAARATAAALSACGGGDCRLVIADCVDQPVQLPPRQG